MLKNLTQRVKKRNEKRKFNEKCKSADDLYYMMGGGCFGCYPPSFFMRHTKEECMKIMQEDRKQLEELIAKLKDENN